MIRFNVSYINKNGARVLFGPNQGRHFHDKREDEREDAEAWLRAFLRHGDAKGIYVKESSE